MTDNKADAQQSSMTISFWKLNKSSFANQYSGTPLITFGPWKIGGRKAVLHYKNKRKKLGTMMFVFRPLQFQEKKKTSFKYYA